MTDIILTTKMTKEFLKEYCLPYDGNLKDTRALYWCMADEVYVNLGAEQFKTYLLDSVDAFINAFTETVIHETVHSEIKTEIGPLFYTHEGEELVCKLMAGQDEDAGKEK